MTRRQFYVFAAVLTVVFLALCACAPDAVELAAGRAPTEFGKLLWPGLSKG